LPFSLFFYFRYNQYIYFKLFCKTLFYIGYLQSIFSVDCFFEIVVIVVYKFQHTDCTGSKEFLIFVLFLFIFMKSEIFSPKSLFIYLLHMQHQNTISSIFYNTNEKQNTHFTCIKMVFYYLDNFYDILFYALATY